MARVPARSRRAPVTRRRAPAPSVATPDVAPQQATGELKPVVVVDGSNIAWEEQTDDGKPRVANIAAVQRELLERGFDVITVIDAPLRHDIDDPDALQLMIDAKTVRQAPAGTDGDYFVIKLAEGYGARIVSNDQYKPYRDEFRWLDTVRWPLMITRGHVTLYDNKGRAR